MKRMLIISTGILIILTPIASLAETSLNTWKCGSTHLIKHGDSIAKVAFECGEPTYKTIKEQTTTGTISGGKFTTRYNETTLITEEWFYNCGEGRLNKYLIFEGGVLKKILSSGRGSGVSCCEGIEKNPNNKQEEK